MRYAWRIIKRNKRGIYLTRQTITEIINLYTNELRARSDNRMTLTGKGEILEKILFQCHLIHHKSHESLPSWGKHKHANIVLNIYYLHFYIFSVICRELVNMAKIMSTILIYFVSQQLQIAGQFSLFCIARRFGLDFSGFERTWLARLSAPIQTGPGTHPTFYWVTGNFQEGTAARAGFYHPLHLEPRLKKE